MLRVADGVDVRNFVDFLNKSRGQTKFILINSMVDGFGGASMLFR